MSNLDYPAVVRRLLRCVALGVHLGLCSWFFLAYAILG